jgi:hypothetical protein
MTHFRGFFLEFGDVACQVQRPLIYFTLYNNTAEKRSRNTISGSNGYTTVCDTIQLTYRQLGMKTVGNGIYSVISFFFDCE